MKSLLKRSAAVFMSLALVFSGTCISAMSENFEDGECLIYDYTSISNQEYALSYLEMLGVLKDDVDVASNVTRGQAVSAIIRALGQEEVAIQIAGSMYTYDEKMAFLAHERAILSGSSPSEWNLDTPVTYAQLSKMLVVALGYGSIITTSDAYPTEYLNYATKLRLNKGISVASDDVVVGGDFAVILSNAMEANIMEVSKVYADELIYKVSEDKTLESVYLESKNLVIGSGIVEADFYTTTVRGAKCKFGQIRINGNTYACESEKLKGYVGYEVEFVYTDEQFDSRKPIYGIRVSEENKVYEFLAGHSAYIEGDELYYVGKNEKQDTLDISSEAIYVVNHTILSSYDLSDIDFGEYTIKIIDNNDEKCDVVFITKSESMIVNYVKDDIIYLSYGTLNSKNIIDLSDYEAETDALIIRDMEGSLKSLDDIKEDTSISVIASEDLSYVEIIILPEPFTGKIEEYRQSENTVKIGENNYGLKISDTEFEIGNTYIMRVTENNEIFYIESMTADCAYIVDVGRRTRGLSSQVIVKIYDNENGIQVFPVAEKAKINGATYTTTDSIFAAIERSTLAYVTMNGKNEVREIKVLDKFGETAKRIYRSTATGFNDIDLAQSLPFRFDENTAFFYVPKSGLDEDFGLHVPMKNKDEYTTQAYELNEDTGFVKAVVVEVDNDMRTGNLLTYSSDVGIVSSVMQVLDAEGQGVYAVNGFFNGESFTYTSGHYSDVFSVCSSLKPGDVIRFIKNYNNEIVRIAKIVSLSEIDGFFHDGKDTVDERFYGRVITLSKNLLTNYSEYLCHEMNVSTTLSYNNLAFMRFYADLVNPLDSKSQFSNYYTYDKNTKEVTLASIDDIISYQMGGEAASKVFVQRSKSDVQCIVIVKE